MFKQSLDELDKSKKYIIVGASKCGTTSFAKYMTDKGFTVDKQDGWFWQNPMIEAFAKFNGTYQSGTPIILLRDPVERAWSHYHYMFQDKPEEDTSEAIKNLRLETVSRKSCYTLWLNKWMEACDDGLCVFWYDDVVEWDDFPHENATKVKPQLDEETRERIEAYIMDEYQKNVDFE